MLNRVGKIQPKKKTEWDNFEFQNGLHMHRRMYHQNLGYGDRFGGGGRIGPGSMGQGVLARMH